MKPGTIIELPDARRGTVVYNGLDGYGFVWGEVSLSEEDIKQILSGDGNCTRAGMPEGFTWEPEAMLRNPYPSAEHECVGEEYKVIRHGGYDE